FGRHINARGGLILEEKFGRDIVKIGPHGENTFPRAVARLVLASSGCLWLILPANKTGVALPITFSLAAHPLPRAHDSRPTTTRSSSLRPSRATSAADRHPAPQPGRRRASSRARLSRRSWCSAPSLCRRPSSAG